MPKRSPSPLTPAERAQAIDADTAASADTLIPAGGELQQQASGPADQLTTNQGVPVADNQNSLKAGPRGPVLLQDFILREKINLGVVRQSPSMGAASGPGTPTNNNFYCDAGYQLQWLHYDCGCTNNATWAECIKA